MPLIAFIKDITNASVGLCHGVDGAFGLKKVADNGGVTLIQDPKESEVKTMPESALQLTKVDYVYSVDQIIRFLQKL